MKKIFAVAAAILLPVFIFAAGETVDKGSPAYDSLESLSGAGFMTVKLDKDKLTRPEAADCVINAVDNLLSEDSAPSMENLEEGYMLLKEFQTDVMEKGKKLSDVQQKMVDLKVRQERLNLKEIKDKQDQLFGMIGVKINGEAKAYMTDLVLFGNDVGNARRYTPVTQYIDLVFSARSGKAVKAEAVFRLENLFGSNWGSEDIFGVRKFTITGDFPVSFILGDYQARLTPLTIWAYDDERENEAKIFRDKRDMIRQEIFLGDNAWPLTGGKLSYKTDTGFPALIEAEAGVARLQEAGKSHYLVSPGYNQAASSLFTYSFDQYLFSARAASDFSLKDTLKAGINFVDIRDIHGTGNNPAAASLENYVASADAKVNLFGIAEARAEFAYSVYSVKKEETTIAWYNTDIADTALMAGVKAGAYDTEIDAEFFVNGNSFTAYAAQSRTYDGYNNYSYITQNNTYNISEIVPYYTLVGKIYPFTKYSNVIVPVYYGVGYNTMPYVFYENNALPYGGATPNRQGIKAKVSGNYFDGILMPYVKFLFASEIAAYLPSNQFCCPREFLVLEGGLKAKLFGAIVYGGYKYEKTQNTYTQGNVDLDSHIIDAAAEYVLFDRLTVHAGFKDIMFKGTEYPYTYNGSGWAYNPETEYDTTIISYGAGLDYRIIEQASAGISFTNTIITDALNDANNFGAQELDVRVSLKF